MDVQLKSGMKVRIWTEEECETLSYIKHSNGYRLIQDSSLINFRMMGQTYELEQGYGGYITTTPTWSIEPWMVAEVIYDPDQPKGWLAGTSSKPLMPSVNHNEFGETVYTIADELYQTLCGSKETQSYLKQCECGKEKHGFVYHSDWCPMYTSPMEDR